MSEAYQLKITQSAIEDFESIDVTQGKKIRQKIQWLAENAEDIPHEALKGNLAGLFRYRFGDYRILYILDKQAKTIEISSVGHRRDVYDE